MRSRVNLKSVIALFFVLGMSLNFTPLLKAQASFDVEKAISSGDHKGLAEYYKSQAEVQRKVVEMHKKMKKSYSESHVHHKGTENVLAGHCGNLQLHAEKAAEEYDALAKQEESLAAKGK